MIAPIFQQRKTAKGIGGRGVQKSYRRNDPIGLRENLFYNRQLPDLSAGPINNKRHLRAAIVQADAMPLRTMSSIWTFEGPDPASLQTRWKV
ncbi:MAG: hypothetical protein LBK26_04070 [Rickettsiales bacterium]|jgi:hypothetical protein|nr:hypothetical protein [Rickettsiales bacterium]